MIKKLKELQEKLKHSERLSAIGQMSSIVGHEIRNPLWAISNGVYYLKSKIPRGDSRAEETISIIEKEVTAINKIVGDLLNFSRLRPPAIKATPLKPLMEDSISVIVVPQFSGALIHEDHLSEFVNLALVVKEIRMAIVSDRRHPPPFTFCLRLARKKVSLVGEYNDGQSYNCRNDSLSHDSISRLAGPSVGDPGSPFTKSSP